MAGADAETIASLLTESTSRLKIEQLGAILIALPSPIGADSLALLTNDIAAAVMPTLSAAEIAELVAHLPAATTRRLLSSLRRFAVH